MQYSKPRLAIPVLVTSKHVIAKVSMGGLTFEAPLREVNIIAERFHEFRHIGRPLLS